MADDAVSASAKGATFLILLQIGSRAVTFGLNQILLRFLSPQLLGVAVQLELYIISTLYFSRESLRIATQRRSDGGVQAAVNLSYVSISLGLPFALFFAYLYLQGNYPDLPYVVEAVQINGLAAMVELLSEPAFVAVQQTMLFKIRAAAEATAVVMKTLTTAGLVFWAHYNDVQLGVLPFACGEFAFSASMSAIFLYQTASAAKQKRFSLWPTKLESSPSTSLHFSLLPTTLLALGASLYVQTGIKWLLTEGDKILIAALATLEDQGMYAVSANYGGLIARMLFKPIEESCRNLFGNLCAAPPPQAKTDPKDVSTSPSSPTQNIQSAANILRDVLHIYSLVSLIAFAVGPTAAPLLLRLVAGQRWSDSGAGEVLGTYCYYIPFMAINGVSEAFVAATASTTELRSQSVWMAGFSVGFATSAYVFLRVLGLGAKGLVLANCVNMSLRIVFNLSYVRAFFRRRGLDFDIRAILPNLYATAAAVVVPSVLSQTEGRVAFLQAYGLLGELVRVGAVASVFVLILAGTERTFWMDCYRRFRQ